MYTLRDLKAVEYKFKHLPGGAKICYYTKETYFLRAGCTACYIADLDSVYMSKKKEKLSRIDYTVYLFVLLHEIVHSTSHPNRLAREYMACYPFDSKRSVTSYIKEQSDNFKLTPDEYDSLEVPLQYYKEEICADRVALKIFKKLGISTNSHALRKKVDIDAYKRLLKGRCKTEETYSSHLKDINVKVDKAVEYLSNLLKI